MKKLITLTVILSLVLSVLAISANDINTPSDMTARTMTILGSEDEGGVRG